MGTGERGVFIMLGNCSLAHLSHKHPVSTGSACLAALVFLFSVSTIVAQTDYDVVITGDRLDAREDPGFDRVALHPLANEAGGGDLGISDGVTSYVAFDDDYLYLRYILLEDPTGRHGFRPGRWGVSMIAPDGRSFRLWLNGSGADDDFGNRNDQAGDTVEVWTGYSPLKRLFAQRHDFAGPDTTNSTPLARINRVEDGSSEGDEAQFHLDVAVPVQPLIDAQVIESSDDLNQATFTSLVLPEEQTPDSQALLATLLGTDFEAGDGNLVRDNTRDWITLDTSLLRVGVDSPTGQSDDSFKASKEDEISPGIDFGSIPNNKSDLTHMYVFSERRDVSGQDKDFLYLAWERVNILGAANIDFEFNQSEQLSANEVTPVRSAGDMLFTYAFSSGGKVVTTGLARWITNAGGVCESNGAVPPCWSVIEDLDVSTAEASFNQAPVYEPFRDITLIEQTFGEMAVNLTDAGVFSDPTSCVNFISAHVKSRSSDSFTATLKDFIAPISVNVANCGTIVIRKEIIPDAMSGSFAFDGTGPSFSDSFKLGDGELREFTGMFTGSYDFTEIVPEGSDLLDIACEIDGPNSTATPDPDTATVNIQLGPGDTVTCTFTNVNKGTIVLEKQTIPDADPQGFEFSGDLTGTVHDGERLTLGVVPGQYEASESVPLGWDLTSVVCDDTDSNGDTRTGTATFQVEPGETVTCTFTNTKRAQILVDKVTDPAGDPQSFDFTLSGGPSAASQAFSLTDAAAPHDSGALLPGSGYSLAEVVPEGWDLTGSTCSDGSPVDNVELSPGETVTCTFTNTKRAVVTIQKQDDATPAKRLPGATFTLWIDNDPNDGDASHDPAEDTKTNLSCTTDSAGECSILYVPLGQYWVVETVPPAHHDVAGDKYVVLGSGAEVTLCFVDRRQFTAIVIVCNEADLRLEASDVMVNGIATRSLGPGDGGSISDAELCALLGARYEDLNAGTFEGEIKISEPATREECSAATVDASRQDPSYTLKKPDRQAESNRD